MVNIFRVTLWLILRKTKPDFHFTAEGTLETQGSSP